MINLPLNRNYAFHATGSIYDPKSNAVNIGADKGKLLSLNIADNNLVTHNVFVCIAVAAINRNSECAGLWHLDYWEDRARISRHMGPTLEEIFAPKDTELYLIGGKSSTSENLAGALVDELTCRGYEISDSALFGPKILDVAVTSSREIHVRDSVRYDLTHEYLMHKAASETTLTQFKIMQSASLPKNIISARPAQPTILMPRG